MDMLTTFDLFDAPTGRNALYIAAKAPRPGLAKTRLARGIGQRTAIDLYRAFLRDLGARFAAPAARGAFSLGWYITPPDAWDDLAPLVSSRRLRDDTRDRARILAQGPGDWTTRQEALFAGAWERGEERTVLIASDSPHLAVEVVAAAFRQLDRHDLVFGPVTDGGYYLIGMRGWCDVLQGIPMSTGTVLQDIVARAEGTTSGKASHLSHHLSPDLPLSIRRWRHQTQRVPRSWVPRRRAAG